MKVLIYLDEQELAPKGGPLGVGFYYYSEMKKRGDNMLSFLHFNKPLAGVRKAEKKIFSFFPKWVKTGYRIIRSIKNHRKLLYGTPPRTGVNFSEYDMVHFHSTLDMYKERENLEGYNGIIILSSHSPIPLGQERCSDLPPVVQKFVPHMRERYEQMDRFAFEKADYIIFPCPEAEEPYYNNWSYYKTIHHNKCESYRYVLTGITPSYAKRDRKTVLNSLNLPHDGFIISYVGRHNSVKGYDRLKEIGEKFLNSHHDSYFIIAGTEGPINRLEHSNWIEIGWTNEPHSYIAASDVFVLPNKETYFDIVMIEVLSLGKIVVASRTGGNKYFEKEKVKGIFLYDTVEEATEILSHIKNMSEEERINLGQENYSFYQTHLTVGAMYDSYIEVLKSLSKVHE